MTSDGIFPQRLTQIDGLIRPDHWRLTEADACYFIGEYTAYQGYAHSATNRLIFNFKKTMDRRGRPEWRDKEQAIQTAAAAFRRALAPKDLDRLTFVPTGQPHIKSLSHQYLIGRWHTIYTRMNRWSKDGVLDRVFEHLQREQLIRLKLEAVSMDSTIVKVHPDGTGARKKTVHRPSASPAGDGPPRFIWLPRMLERR